MWRKKYVEYADLFCQNALSYDKIACMEQDINQSEKTLICDYVMTWIWYDTDSLTVWTVFPKTAYKRPPAAILAAGA